MAEIDSVGVGAGGDAVLTVAAADTPTTLKDRADYICDGTIDTGGDQTEINAALAAADIVYLCPGTFYVSASISIGSNQSLVSDGATIMLKSGINADVNMITNSDQAAGNENILLRGLTLDGNKANITARAQCGVYFETVGTATTPGCRIENCIGKNFRYPAFYLYTIYNCVVKGNTVIASDETGMYLHDGAYNIVSGNICIDNNDAGIEVVGVGIPYSTVIGNVCNNNGYGGILVEAEYCSIVGNTCRGNMYGIITFAANNTITGNTTIANVLDGMNINFGENSTITGNTLIGNGRDGIAIGSDYCTVSGNTATKNDRQGIAVWGDHNNINGNTVYDNGKGAAATYDGIFIKEPSDYNNIQNNIVRIGAGNTHRYGIRINAIECEGNLVRNNDLYNAGVTANLSDAGSGTVTLIGDHQSNRGV